MKNIFQLYVLNQKIVPFVVRRQNWSDGLFLVVTSVRPSGDYGSAFGYGFPLGDFFRGTPDNPLLIACAGCYQWEFSSDCKLDSIHSPSLSLFPH